MKEMRWQLSLVVSLSLWSSFSVADELIVDVESQPLRSQVSRIVEALEYIGQPLDSRQHAALMKLETAESNEYVTKIQQLLDQLVIANVHINAESRVKVTSGPAKPDLVQNGWSTFLIKVHNEAGITPALRIDSPSNQPIFIRSGGAKDPDPGRIDVQDIEDRWLELGTFDKQPLMPTLSGLALEYRILSIYAATAGQREATLTFDAGQGTQDLGFRSELPILFKSRESTPVTLRVFDHDGSATVGQFVIRDKQGRIYPSRFRRLEPDFYFHDQIYRYDKEVIHLPPGNYEFVVTRGPEYIAKTHEINITDQKPMTLEFRLERWI